MTTLAQRVMETDWSPVLLHPLRGTSPQLVAHYRSVGQQIVETTRRALRPDSVALPPGYSAQDIAALTAERYVFVDDAPRLMQTLMDSGAVSRQVPSQLARLPAPVTWVEWRLDDDAQRSSRGLVQMGVLCLEGWATGESRDNRTTRDTTLLTVWASTDGRAAPLFVIECPHMTGDNVVDGRSVGMHWVLNKTNPGDLAREDKDQVITVVHELFEALFLINTPRVSEIVDVVHDAPLQRARARRGKLPLLEYRRVQLCVGEGAKVWRSAGPRVTSPGAEVVDGAHRRLHSVVGHFRTRLREDGRAPLVSYVPHHWRGDPALGLVVREREVRGPRRVNSTEEK